LNPQLAAADLRPLLEDPFALIDAPPSVLLRRRRDTAVFRRSAEGHDVVIKHFDGPGPKEMFETLVHGTKALLEFRRALELERRGVAVPRPMFYAVKRRFLMPRESLYVMEFLPGTRTVWALVAEEAALGDFRGRRRVRFLRALAEFLVKLAREGIRHPDQHLANVLVREEGGRIEFFLIDFRHLDFSGRDVIEDLVSMVAPGLVSLWVMDTRSRSDRRLLAAVLSALGASRGERRALAAGIWDGVRRWWARYIGSQDQKCLRDGSRFEVVRDAASTIIFRKGEESRRALAAASAAKTGGVLGPGPLRTVGDGAFWVLDLPAGDDQRAERIWVGAERLAVRRLPSPRQLVFRRRPDGSSTLIFAAVPGTFDVVPWSEVLTFERGRRIDRRLEVAGLTLPAGARALLDRSAARVFLLDMDVDEPMPFPLEPSGRRTPA
jgi:tRNA A-37 threonylcarbamoyl transferase component Bud32